MLRNPRPGKERKPKKEAIAKLAMLTTNTPEPEAIGLRKLN